MKASIKLITSQRKTKKGFPIIVEVFYSNKERLKKTIGHSKIEDWDQENTNLLKTHEEYYYFLPILLDFKAKVSKINYLKLNLKEASELLEIESFTNKSKTKGSLLHFFDIFISEKKAAKQSTELAEQVKKDLSNKISKDFQINDITYEWLNSYRIDRLRPKTSGAGTMSYLKIIRSVFKEAQRRESLNVKKGNPFLGVIKKIPSKQKEILSVNDFSVYLNYKPNKSTTNKSKYILKRRIELSYFQFLTGGIDLIDLALLEWKNLKNNRVKFKRYKNRNKPNANIVVNNILVEDALRIISKYGDKNNKRVFSFIPNPKTNYANYKEYRNRYSRTLKKVCDDLNIPKVTSKTMRYVFRTLAGELLIHDIIVMKLQGHKPEGVTYRYQGKIQLNIQDEQHQKIIQLVTNQVMFK